MVFRGICMRNVLLRAKRRARVVAGRSSRAGRTKGQKIPMRLISRDWYGRTMARLSITLDSIARSLDDVRQGRVYSYWRKCVMTYLLDFTAEARDGLRPIGRAHSPGIGSSTRLKKSRRNALWLSDARSVRGCGSTISSTKKREIATPFSSLCASAIRGTQCISFKLGNRLSQSLREINADASPNHH